MLEPQPIVFLLDDDQAVVISLGRMLQASGFVVRMWTSAAEFLEAHDAETPGCLVTDLRMPEMSGLELQRALLERGSDRAIVFVTGQGDIPTTVQAMKAGAVSFLAKPVHRAELVAAVQEALLRDAEGRAQHREHEELVRRLASLTPRERHAEQADRCRAGRGRENHQGPSRSHHGEDAGSYRNGAGRPAVPRGAARRLACGLRLHAPLST